MDYILIVEANLAFYSPICRILLIHEFNVPRERKMSSDWKNLVIGNDSNNVFSCTYINVVYTLVKFMYTLVFIYLY